MQLDAFLSMMGGIRVVKDTWRATHAGVLAIWAQRNPARVDPTQATHNHASSNAKSEKRTQRERYRASLGRTGREGYFLPQP